MIIYGSRTTHLLTEQTQEPCANCKTANSIIVSIFQKYAHVFWIPFFPIGKTGVSQCSHCKQTFTLKQMPPILNNAYYRIAAKTKTPVWTFAGIFLIVVLGIGVSIHNHFRIEEEKEYIASPKAGDIYDVQTGVGRYTIYKVEKVAGDSVYFRPNKYEIDKMTGVSKLMKEKSNEYSDELLVTTKAKIKELYDKRNIYGVHRK